MTQEYILNELKIIFKQINPNIDIASVTLDTKLVEDLGLDSLTILMLSFAIEKKFEIKFSGTPKFATVGEVVEDIEILTA